MKRLLQLSLALLLSTSSGEPSYARPSHYLMTQRQSVTAEQSEQANSIPQVPFEIEGILEEKDQADEALIWIDRYSFEGQAGEIVKVTLTSDTFVPLIGLFNSDQDMIASDDDTFSLGYSEVVVQLPQSGTYSILVSAVEGSEGGNYQLKTTFGDETALALSQEKEQINDLALSIFELFSDGSVELENSNYRAAIDLFSQALSLSQTGTIPAGLKRNIFHNIGRSHSNLGAYPQGLDFLQQALAIAQEDEANDASSDKGSNTILNDIAIIYQNQGNYVQALEIYEQQLKKSEVIGDREDLAIALGNIAIVYSSLDRYSEALQYHQQALAIERDLKKKRDIGFSLINIGAVYNSASDYGQALDSLNQGLIIVREEGDRLAEANALNHIGSSYSGLGEYAQAMDYYEQALSIFQAFEVQDDIGNALNNIGNKFDNLGQYQQALDAYQQTLEIAKKNNDVGAQGTALNNIGVTYSNIGEYSNALESLQQALAISRKTRSLSSESVALSNIGLLYNGIGQYSQALEVYQQSLEIARKIESKYLEGVALGNIGHNYFHLEQYSQAISFFEKGLAIEREIKSRADEGSSLGNIAGAYREIGDYTQALNFHQQALAIVRDVEAPYPEASILRSEGDTYKALGQYQKAQRNYRQALAITREIGNVEGEAMVLSRLGQLFRTTGEPQLAIIFFKQSVNALEAIRAGNAGLNGSASLNKEQQQSYTDTVADTYRELADLLLQENRVFEAQRVLDLLRVQELEDYLGNVPGNEKTAGGVEYQQLEQDIISGIAQSNDFADSDEIQALTEQLRSQESELVDREGLASLQDNLAAIDAVLFYPLILEDRIELVVTTADALPQRRTVEGVDREMLEQTIAEFRMALQEPTSDAIAPAQKLYKWLIEPIETDLTAAGVETIVYSPDGALRHIPLTALHSGEQWIAERFRVNNITAQSLIELDIVPQKEPEILAGAFADNTIIYPIKGNSYRGLPFAGQEVEFLDKTLPAITSLFDKDFTLKEVTHEIDRFNILHFATHAAFISKDPTESFILFGDGTTQNLDDIRAWALSQIDLVVLSACETGLGQFDNEGGQILGLGHRFQQGGARAVIASLWQVNDGSTQLLMNDFYSTLGQGRPKNEALQQAQQAMIASDLTVSEAMNRRGLEVIDIETGKPIQTQSQLSHPHYWAPFILIGNGL